MSSSTYAPVPKVVAVGLGGALATLVVWLVNVFTGVEVPATPAAALSALLAFGAGYLKTPAGATDDGHVAQHTADDGRALLAAIGVVLLVSRCRRPAERGSAG